ncbi:hypothetical protein KY285_014510 [Solanum tuberosum]|nr:hypothetical protein KY289_014775 [Solanum tuberosum]KAH0700261.1 hypothetical protein KY284_014476 [Solanum tuberosum]KAH0718479.1 hypothetical protein KY285_014510 [Solanum tuberosum]
MEPSTYSEIRVSPEIVYAIGDCPVDDFNVEINLIVKYAYNYGESTLEEFNCDNTCCCKYKSLSWDNIDEMLLGTNFPYQLERVKWINRTEKILANKDDLIKQILEYTHHNIVTCPPHEYLDEIIVNLIFVKQVSVNLQEFELTKARIVAADREYFAELLWKSVHDKIMRVKQRGSSSLYEEFKWMEYFIENIVNGISVRSNMCYDENYERELKESFIEQARKEFRSLPVVRSKIQFLKKVNLPNHDDTLAGDICSICMETYLPDSEAYNMPCNHNFHFNCIETWILKDPSCPMCRYKLPAIETSEPELEI